MSGLDGVQLHRVDSLDDAMAFKRWLSERRPILAVDTETTGLDITGDRVRLVQFGDGMQGWTLRRSRWLGLVEETFREYEGEYVFHNAPYDWAMLANDCGIKLPQYRIHDTMVMAHVLDSTRYVGLKPLSTLHIDSKAGVSQAMLDKAFDDNNWGWATVPYEVPVYSVYAAMDTVLTARMYELLMPEVQQRCPRAYDLEMAFAWAVMRMRMRGVRVDRQYTQESLDSFTAYVKQADEWCVSNFGVKPGTNAAVIDRFRQDGIEVKKYTCGCVGDDAPREDCEKPRQHHKNLALDKEVLGYIIKQHQHPLAEVVLQRRRTQKLASTYLKNFIRLSDDDGTLRANMKSLGTRTARMAITEPALQTLPRRSDDNPLAITVRNCVVPSDDDHVLVMTDWAQIEMRMLAHLCQDPGLQSAFTEGDFFTRMTQQIFQDPSIVKKDPRRQTTKNAMYAKAYGAGVAKFSLTAGITLDQGTEFMRRLDGMFPGITEFQRTVDQVARDRVATEGRAYVKSPLTGRILYADKGKEYSLVNYLIQCGAAEVLKMKVVELDQLGVGDYLTLLVHDEIIADVPRTEVRDVSHVIESVMYDDRMFDVPLTAESEFGFRWGSKGNLTLDDIALEAA